MIAGLVTVDFASELLDRCLRALIDETAKELARRADTPEMAGVTGPDALRIVAKELADSIAEPPKAGPS